MENRVVKINQAEEQEDKRIKTIGKETSETTSRILT